MTTYYNHHEIETSMKSLVKEYLQDCRKCEVLPEDFVELIKHNFLAKFVCFNRETRNIEIGVEDFSEKSIYPQIKIFKFPVDSTRKWVENSLKSGKNDLQFYGRLLNRRKAQYKNAEVVVM